MNGDEDIQLVKAFKNGDEKAFDRLFEKYQVSLYSLCYRYVRNDADARELVLDVFTKVYRNLTRFREHSKFFTWLYRIAVNTCISYKRKNRRRDVPYSPEKGAENRLEEKVHMKVAIDDALTKLPKRQRLAFILHHYEGYTFEEVGRIMSITTGAAKAHNHHAIRKLRRFLKDWL
jgi:RNA polymerase sigma-70 factor (ECF subfamily)